MRKAFLPHPVDFTRISSNFNLKRLHPIYKTTRPHRGTLTIAPTGTPFTPPATPGHQGRLHPRQRQLRVHPARLALRHPLPAPEQAQRSNRAEGGAKPGDRGTVGLPARQRAAPAHEFLMDGGTGTRARSTSSCPRPRPRPSEWSPSGTIIPAPWPTGGAHRQPPGPAQPGRKQVERQLIKRWPRPFMSGSCPAPASMASIPLVGGPRQRGVAGLRTHTPYPPRCAPPSKAISHPGDNEIERLGPLDWELGGLFADAPPWPCSATVAVLCGRSATTDRRAPPPLATPPTPPTVLHPAVGRSQHHRRNHRYHHGRGFSPARHGGRWRGVPHWPRRFTPRRSPGRASTAIVNIGDSQTSPCWRGNLRMGRDSGPGNTCWITGYSATGNTATATASGPRRAR